MRLLRLPNVASSMKSHKALDFGSKGQRRYAKLRPCQRRLYSGLGRLSFCLLPRAVTVPVRTAPTPCRRLQPLLRPLPRLRQNLLRPHRRPSRQSPRRLWLSPRRPPPAPPSRTSRLPPRRLETLLPTSSSLQHPGPTCPSRPTAATRIWLSSSTGPSGDLSAAGSSAS